MRNTSLPASSAAPLLPAFLTAAGQHLNLDPAATRGAVSSLRRRQAIFQFGGIHGMGQLINRPQQTLHTRPPPACWWVPLGQASPSSPGAYSASRRTGSTGSQGTIWAGSARTRESGARCPRPGSECGLQSRPTPSRRPCVPASLPRCSRQVPARCEMLPSLSCHPGSSECASMPPVQSS